MSDLPRPPAASQVPSISGVQTPSIPEVRYGGFWLRATASSIDSVIILLVCVVLGFFQGLWSNESSIGTFRGQVIFQLIILVINILYYGWMQGKYQGTPGKRLLGLRLVRSDLSPVEVSRSVARYFASILSGLVLGLGYLWVGFDSKKRSWHDLMAGTLVIRDP